MTTLQRSKLEGGWALPNVEAKCKTLLYSRILTLGKRAGTVTSDLLRYWHIPEALQNPPYVPRIPHKLTHLRQYVTDMAYVTTQEPDETRQQYKRKAYAVLLRLLMNNSPQNEMRIVRKYPSTNWTRVWKNLHTNKVPDAIKSTWYVAVHDLIPTNDRLAAINLTDTNGCTTCGHPDSLQHRITDCKEGPIIWTQTRKIIAIMLRTDHRHIPQDWALRPAFQLWPPQRHSAILWILAHFVHYRLQAHRRLSLVDYMDFLRRARWKLYNRARRPYATGRYLDVIDWQIG
jgi:hypothetical protein